MYILSCQVFYNNNIFVSTQPINSKQNTGRSSARLRNLVLVRWVFFLGPQRATRTGTCVCHGCVCCIILQLFHSSRSRLLPRTTRKRGNRHPLNCPTPSSRPIATSMVTLPSNRQQRRPSSNQRQSGRSVCVCVYLCCTRSAPSRSDC